MQYLIEFRPSVVKNLKRLPKHDLIRIKNRIESLTENPKGIHASKLKGNNPFYRVRSGKYRIIYQINNDKLVILVVKVGHRKDVYKYL